MSKIISSRNDRRFAVAGRSLIVSWLILSISPPLLYAQQQPVAPGPRGSLIQDQPALGKPQPAPALKSERSVNKGKVLNKAREQGEGSIIVINGQPIKAESLKKGDLDRLPDNQVIEVKGQRMTTGEIRSKMQQARTQDEVKAKEATQKAQAEFETYRAKFLQDQQARLQAENAKVQAEFARLRQQPSQTPQPAGQTQLDTIRQEARQLLERSKTAPPAEQAQIEQRAEQLLRQLDQMGIRSPAATLQPAGQLPQPRPMGR